MQESLSQDAQALIALHKLLTTWVQVLPPTSPVRAEFEIALNAIDEQAAALTAEPRLHVVR